MKKRILYISIALWALAVIVTAFAGVVSENNERVTALYADGCEVGDTLYITEHLDKGSVLYTMDKNGKVSNVFVSDGYEKGTVLEQVSYNKKLYGVLEKTAEVTNGTEKQYRIIRFDENGAVDGQSPVLKREQNGELTGFWADDSGFYLGTVFPGGEQAGIHYLDPEIVADLTSGETDESGKAVEPAPVAMQLVQLEEAGGIRCIAAIDYRNGESIIWKDNGKGAADFTKNHTWTLALAQKDLTVVQHVKLNIGIMTTSIIAFFAGIVIILLASRFLKGKSHIFYTIVAMEAVLAVTTLAGALAIPYMQNLNRAEESRRFGYYYLQDAMNSIEDEYLHIFSEDRFYTQTEYERVCEKLTALTEAQNGQLSFSDVCLVRTSDGVIVASASGKSGIVIDNVYTVKAGAAVRQIAEGETNAINDVQHEGKSLKALAVGIQKSLTPEYALLGIASDEILVQSYRENQLTSLMIALVIFLTASGVVIYILSKRGKELQNLAQAMKAVADGEKEIGQKTAHSKDIDSMWNSLFETEKSINRSNYDKYKVFESCYRFAPKNIEKILGKDSVTEVKGGDVAKIDGTVAIITSTDETDTTDIACTMNGYMTVLEKHREEKDGLFVSGHSSLNKLKVLFLDSVTETVQFGVSMLHEMNSIKSVSELRPGVFLHYSNYIYGIAGTETQSFPFLISKELKKLEDFARWLRDMNVKMVLTETVTERETDCGELRYIGYILFDDGERKLNLYEALDACSVGEKYRKQKTMAKFNEAIKLLYQHDFYFARNTFSDVLKENPDDMIAKWYLFTCEKYLNEISPDKDVCALQIDERFSQNI